MIQGFIIRLAVRIVSFGILLAVIYYIYTTYFPKKSENFVNNTKKSKLAEDIFNFINEETTFPDYLDFLSKNPNNLSYELLKQEIFYEFKLLKKNKTLTQQIISDKITDM